MVLGVVAWLRELLDWPIRWLLFSGAIWLVLAVALVVYLVAVWNKWSRVRQVARVAVNIIGLVALLLLSNVFAFRYVGLPLLVVWTLYLVTRWQNWPKRLHLVTGVVLAVLAMIFLIWLVMAGYYFYLMFQT